MFFENLISVGNRRYADTQNKCKANSIGTRVVGDLKPSKTNRKDGEKMTASETLKLISKQWCSLNDLMKLGQFGRNSALKIKREIKNKLVNQGYRIPKHLVPMKEVVDYLDININYLESRVERM